MAGATEKDKPGTADSGRAGAGQGSTAPAKADKDDGPTKEQQRALDGRPVYDPDPDEDVAPREQRGTATTREVNDARDKAVAERGGGVARPVPSGMRPAESSDPVVHQLLAELQNANTNENEEEQKRIGDRLKAMGYDVG